MISPLKGVIELLEDFTVCKTGDKLNSDQTQILKLFDHRLVEFRFLFAEINRRKAIYLISRLSLLACWSLKSGFQQIDGGGHTEMDE